MATSPLVPREHGTYAELLLPLLTGLALGRLGFAASMFAVSAVLGFLVSEPVAVLTGVRGTRDRRLMAAEARRRLVVLASVLVLTGGAAVVTAPAAARLAALVPLAGVVALIPVGLRGRIKTIGGELLVAATLTATLLPVALAGGAGWSYSLAAALVWLVSFVLATLTVHAIKVRSVGSGEAHWTLVLAPTLAGVAIAAGVVVALTWGWLFMAGLAVLPMAVATLAIHLARVHARQMRTVGWSLVVANLATAALLVAGR